ncbi:uncharacterized protein LOC111636247 [Centruroides sculpturatus]|uniref:uncharacterized protein LOC111636247 n=1 Tax=Centruroides sculpturatus TaxID=218467 RepID=UPI000C6EBA84|nr:uncharacterized protein LOC111636247 [Centruroides sculpturatus]
MIRKFLPILFSLICLTYCEEQDNGKLKQCLNSLQHCLKQRFCYSRSLSINEVCCKKGFESGKYNNITDDKCRQERVKLDITDCLSEIDFDCKFLIIMYLAPKKSYFEYIKYETRLFAGLPEIEDDCEKFSKRVEREMWHLCLERRNQDLEWVCDLFFDVYKESPFMNENCLSSFKELFTDIVDYTYVK